MWACQSCVGHKWAVDCSERPVEAAGEDQRAFRYPIPWPRGDRSISSEYSSGVLLEYAVCSMYLLIRLRLETYEYP